jgi:glucose-6-phosphate 1-dehydrogenase
MPAGHGPLPLACVIIGASGDLTARKLMPAFFALYARGLLPPETRFYGFARSALTDAAFRQRLAARLVCDDIPGSVCDPKRRDFLERCAYEAGAYDDPAALRRLRTRLAADWGDAFNTLYYMAVPPSLFAPVGEALRQSGNLRDGGSGGPWTRVVIEKPFGSDRRTSDELTAALLRVFSEEQTYRIDHYLGKEAIQNLMVLRFANTVFEPLWNRRFIRHVHVAWSEDLSLAGRAGYFDGYGIVRDVMQNHLTQMLALLAMECPRAMGSKGVGDAKARLLRQVAPLTRDRVALGQYTAGEAHGIRVAGYRDEPGVPPDSRTATYAAAVVEVANPRWRGVPFLLSAGKGLTCRRTEIRIHFRPPAHALFRAALAAGGEGGAALRDNELTIRVQPDEQIVLSIVGKAPGLGFRLDRPRLDLIYGEAYAGARIGDAYETLLLDTVRGDRGLFIRADELAASWDIFTPLLHEMDAAAAPPDPYPFGSCGPASRLALAQRFGIEDA